MSDNQMNPWAFRPDDDVRSSVENFTDLTGWGKSKLFNEALRIAIPTILADQARKYAALSEPPTTYKAKKPGFTKEKPDQIPVPPENLHKVPKHKLDEMEERKQKAESERARQLKAAGLPPDHKGPIPDSKKKKP